jgi:hypothetical protein
LKEEGNVLFQPSASQKQKPVTLIKGILNGQRLPFYITGFCNEDMKTI